MSGDNPDVSPDVRNAGYYRCRDIVDDAYATHTERFRGLVYVHKTHDGRVVAIELLSPEARP